MHSPTIPSQAQTLQILRALKAQPMLMLPGDADGYGARWMISGQEIMPAIACFLMDSGYLAETGKTELGARILTLTDEGHQFREKGLAWWSTLNWLEKLKITLFG